MLLVLVGGVVSANAGNVSVYIKPTEGWLNSSPFLGVWVYNSSDENNTKTWATISSVSGQSGVYCATFADTQNKLIIVRLNPSGSDEDEPNWDNKWNQSAELDIYPDKLYTISSADDNSSATITYLPWDFYFMSTKSGDWKIESKMENVSGNDYTCTFSGSEFAGKRVGWASGDAFNTSGAIIDWGKKYQSTSTNAESSDHWITFKTFVYDSVVQGDGSAWKVPPTDNQYNDGTITIEFNSSTGKTTIYSQKDIAINGAQFGDYYYATFSCKYDVAIPSDVKAYYASGTGDGKVTMSAFSNGIRSSEGAFLRLPEASRTYTFSSTVSTDNPSTNLLVPGTTSGLVAGDYVFAKQNNTVGFYKITSALGTDMTGRAYIAAASVTAPALNIEFEDGETTGIYRIEANEFQQNSSNGQMYDLQGRRVVEPSKGIYIVNGKKVIIK